MIEQRIDLWAAGRLADAICITTNGTIKSNGAGVMGRGCAKEALTRFPRIDRTLGRHLRGNGNVVGILIERFLAASDRPVTIVAFPVKHHWDQPADIALIVRSLQQLVALTSARGWQRVILPRPGCGNGGLQWEAVEAHCAHELDDRFVVVTK